ncbi:unnamed protein product, partial [Mesorhabditis spiculigera]
MAESARWRTGRLILVRETQFQLVVGYRSGCCVTWRSSSCRSNRKTAYPIVDRGSRVRLATCVRLPRCRLSGLRRECIGNADGVGGQVRDALSPMTVGRWILPPRNCRRTRVPNLATTAFTREGFVSAKGDRHDRCRRLRRARSRRFRWGKKDLESSKASITAENVHVKVDACMGPVTIRSYAQLSVSTATSDNTLFVCSDPAWLLTLADFAGAAGE